jgi:hypothetical protein
VVSSVSAFREMVEGKLRTLGVTPRVVAEARNFDAVKELVERNVGYSMHLKPLAAAEIAAGRFAPLRLDGPLLLGEIVMAFRSRPSVSPLIAEFARFMRADLEPPRGGHGAETSTRMSTTITPRPRAAAASGSGVPMAKASIWRCSRGRYWTMRSRAMPD